MIPVGSPRSSFVEKLPERAHHPRLDQLELAEQVVLAGVDLLRQRVAVAGRAAFEDVGDEDVAAREADLLEQRVEQPAGLADERQALLVLVRARAPRRRTSGRRRRCRSRRRRSVRGGGELRAARARLRLPPDGLELLAALSSGVRIALLTLDRRRRRTRGRHLRDGPRTTLTRSRYLREGTGLCIAIVGAGRLGTALAAALLRAGYAVRGPLGRGADARRRDGRAAVRARRRDRRRSGRGRRPARSSATAPAPPGSTSLAPHEAFSLHPLMTVPAGAPPTVFAGAGCAVDGTTPRALGDRRGAGGARSGMRADAGRRRGPRRLPRGRLDRVELPRHARGRRRAAGGDRRASIASCSCRSCAPRSRTGPPRAPSARSPARSPAATRRPSRASARRSRSARPTCCRCSTRWSTRRGAALV